MADNDELFDFPCRFPIKAVGRESEGFPAHVLELISVIVGPVSNDDVAIRPSSGGRFISVTITITAESRDQLDRIYQQLSASELVLFAL